MSVLSKTNSGSISLALSAPVWLIFLLFSISAWATPMAKLKPLSGPPTSALHITGNGFAPHETVAIAFGVAPIIDVKADAAGAFTGDIKVPVSARPGKRNVTAVGESSGLSAVEIFTVNTNWSMFNFNAGHSGYNPYENILNPANVHRLTEKWRVQNYNLRAYEVSPVVYDGIIYASSYDSHLYAFNATDGILKWQVSTSGSSTTPAVSRGVVYVAASGGFYAFNADNGQQKWMTPFNMGITTNAVVANGIVYAGSSNNSLYALSAANGELLWKRTLDDRADMSTPAVANGVIYIGSWKGTIYAFNALDGSLKWKKALTQWGLSAPAFANGKIYITGDGELYALNAADGSLKWKTADSCGGSSLVAADGGIYVNGNGGGYACAVNAADGRLKWRAPTGSDSPVAVANGVVYAGSWDSTLYALKASDGNLKWKGAAGFLMLSAPAVANGMVFVITQTGDLYAFHLAAP